MDNKCKNFLSVWMRKDNLRQRGITLIALIITIVVLLILAGVVFGMLTSENGILKRAVEAVEISKEKSADEKVNFLLNEYAIDKYTKEQTSDNPLYDFFEEQKEKGEIDNVYENDAGNIVIEVDGYEYEIDKETSEIITGPDPVDPSRPVFAVTLTDIDEIVLKEHEDFAEVPEYSGEKQALTVNITNAASFGNNYNIEVKHSDGTVVTEEITPVVGEGQKSYEIERDGIYTVKVTAGQVSAIQSKAITLQFTKAYGKIDIIWLNANNEKIDEPEEPVLGDKLQPIKWTNNTEENVINAEEDDWYDYVAQSGSTDGKTSRWANAKLVNGSSVAYFVWIPRYAYKITYYSDAAKTNEIGYSQIDGMVKKSSGKVVNGTNPINVKGEVKTGGYTEYIPHPGFEFGESKTGMWVGKYESSGAMEGTAYPETALPGTSLPLVNVTSNISIKPGVQSIMGHGRKNGI